MLSHDELLDRGGDDDEADDERSDSAGVQKEAEWESLWSRVVSTLPPLQEYEG